MLRRGAAAAVLLAVGVAVIIVAAASGNSGTLSYKRAAARALELWKGFPVSAQPRPVIALGGGTVVLPQLRNGRDQDAVDEGSFKLATRLPTGQSVLRGYRLIAPAQAYSELREGAKQVGNGLPVLKITAIRLSRAVFITDRGRTSLPAWQFRFREFRQPADVLAVEPYSAPATRRLDPYGIGNSQDGEQAIVSDGGRKLKISFVGGPPGTKPCDDSYTTYVDASRQAVVFALIDHPASSGDVACSLVGYLRTVRVRIAEPLGSRVLVDGTNGGAIPAARLTTFRW